MKSNAPSVVFVSCGSNQGRRKNTLEKAILLLRPLAKHNQIKVSSLYETSPVGGPQQQPYFNCLVKFKTILSPPSLLKCLQKIEISAGRKRLIRWGARTLDLDIIAYGSIVRGTRQLIIPHPRYHQRRFVLVPFDELAPRFIHPRLKKKNKVFLSKLTLPGQRVTMLGKWTDSQFSLFKKRKKLKNRSSL